MPDALSKTVPIWCAVVNRAISLRRQQHDAEATSTSGWDVELYTPAGVVSSQEHHQIALRLDGWAKALVVRSQPLCFFHLGLTRVLQGSSFVLPLDLAAPLRPFWITPATATFPVLQTISSSSPPFLPVVCVSASKHVDYGMERRVAGYVHVQGSGDDHELWGMVRLSTLCVDI
jgi:tRNA A64-2'-O-ribosylphosphate transferase